jgi:putative spermidine/putrescine transport system ATP-binding protein
MAFLSIQGACKRYGAATALDNVSLDVGRGELIALLGPSGSGKSTLLMSVAGFVALDQGDIVLDGKSIRHLPPFKRNFGVVFQQYALFPHMTVEQNVAYPLSVRGMARSERKAAVTRALERVQLTGHRTKYPNQLSGGQQQRVALARALVFEPPLLLMDEPLGALDRKLRVEMQHEIRSIQQDLKITTLYVTHDQDEAMSLADRIAVVNNGHIEQIAHPLAIYDQPSSDFVANFIGEANLFRGTISESVNGHAIVSTATGCAIEVPRSVFGKGESVTVLVRPEQVALTAQSSDARAGVIRHCSYFGSSVRCVVEMQGEHVIAIVPRHRLAFEPNIGAPVGVSWDKDSARVIGPDATKTQAKTMTS